VNVVNAGFHTVAVTPKIELTP